MADKFRFAYGGLDQINLPRKDRAYYQRFMVWYKPTGKTILDFYTNKDFEGWFEYNGSRCLYEQKLGTFQFTLSHNNVNSARNHLRRLVLKQLCCESHWCYSCGKYSDGIYYECRDSNENEFYQCKDCYEKDLWQFDHRNDDTCNIDKIQVVHKDIYVPGFWYV